MDTNIKDISKSTVQTSLPSMRAGELQHWEKLSETLSRCLLMKESREVSGIYGIGLKIDTARIPYIVKEGSMIFDEHGKAINDSVNVGDTIANIDGYPMEKVERVERSGFFSDSFQYHLG